MQRNSTIGELMERKRIQDGAKEYQGHTYMDLARFDDATKHMIIFDVLTDESPVGWKGERNRLYLSDVGYQKALDNQKAGNIKIISHAAVLKLVTTLIANTKGDGKAGDEFWTKAETLLYCALIGYIHYEAPVEEQNFSTLIEFLNAMEVREDDEEFQNPVDLMFEALEKKKPNHFAVRQYKKYKLAAGKTAKSILISCGARLAPFDIQEVRDVTAYDELQLDTLGDKKTALFLIMSDTDAILVREEFSCLEFIMNRDTINWILK